MVPEKGKKESQELAKLVQQTSNTLERLDQRLAQMSEEISGLYGGRLQQGPGIASRFQQSPSIQTAHPAFGSQPSFHANPLFSDPSTFMTGGFPPNVASGQARDPQRQGQETPGPAALGGIGTVLNPFQIQRNALGQSGSGGIGRSPPTGQISQTPTGQFGDQEPHSSRELESLPPQTRIPTCTISDEGKEVHLEIELPGVKKEDIDLTVNDRVITLSAEAVPEIGEGAVLMTERVPVHYQRTIPLPSEVKAGTAKATTRNGILSVKIEKKVASEGARRVDIK